MSEGLSHGIVKREEAGTDLAHAGTEELGR